MCVFRMCVYLFFLFCVLRVRLHNKYIKKVNRKQRIKMDCYRRERERSMTFTSHLVTSVNSVLMKMRHKSK